MYRLIGCIIICLLLTRCASDRPEGKTDAEVLYKESLELIKKERYLIATEKLNSLKAQYPYSYYATHAELLLADILFYQENYLEAAASYLLFKDFHPKYKDMEYVIWQLAESNYKQLPDTFDRDLTSSKDALKYYNEILVKYNKPKYREKCLKRIKKIETLLKQKELYIADFYFRTEVYDSAIFRYKGIIKQYDDKETQDLAISRIVKASYNNKKYSECLNYIEKYKDKVSQGLKEDMLGLEKKCQALNN